MSFFNVVKQLVFPYRKWNAKIYGIRRNRSFWDLIAMNALYRPGPIAYIPSFIKRKNGEEEIVYNL